MDPVSLVSNIVSLAQAIYDQVQLVTANQEKSRHLADRIRQIVSSLARLRSLPRNTQFLESLTALNTCLDEIRNFITQFTAQRSGLLGRAKRLLFAQDHQSEFQEFNTRLGELLPQLNIGLNAQVLMDREEDREDAERDQQVLRELQEKICEELAAQGEHRDRQDHKLDEHAAAIQLVVAKLASIREYVACHESPTRRTSPIPLPVERSPSPSGDEYYARAVLAHKRHELETAFDAYQRAARKNYPKALTSLGLFALQGDCTRQPRDPGLALRYLTQAADAGHTRAMHVLGKMYQDGDGVPRDLAQSHEWYQRVLATDPTDSHAEAKVASLSLLLGQAK